MLYPLQPYNLDPTTPDFSPVKTCDLLMSFLTFHSYQFALSLPLCPREVMHAHDSNILENTRVTCHVTLASDERQSGAGQAVDNMLLLFLMMICFANCKYPTGFIDYFEC